jgi:hypothetical protein
MDGMLIGLLTGAEIKCLIAKKTYWRVVISFLKNVNVLGYARAGGLFE